VRGAARQRPDAGARTKMIGGRGDNQKKHTRARWVTPLLLGEHPPKGRRRERMSYIDKPRGKEGSTRKEHPRQGKREGEGGTVKTRKETTNQRAAHIINRGRGDNGYCFREGRARKDRNNPRSGAPTHRRVDDNPRPESVHLLEKKTPPQKREGGARAEKQTDERT